MRVTNEDSDQTAGCVIIPHTTLTPPLNCNISLDIRMVVFFVVVFYVFFTAPKTATPL